MKLELKIINLLARNKEKRFTINAIAKALKGHYSLVHRIVSRLTKEGVIEKTKVGNSYICSINKDNDKTHALLQLSEIERRNEFYSADKELKLILEDLVKSFSQEGNALSIILFGSYAKGTATKESDIDILLLSNKNKKTEKTAKEIYAKYGKEVNIVTMSPSKAKKQKEDIIMKEIKASHIILHGIEKFVDVILR